MTRPTVAEACARAVEAWLKTPQNDDCAACRAAEDSVERSISDLTFVAAWSAEESDPSCEGCHAMMTELAKLEDPAGAVALAVGREEGRAGN